MAEGKVFYKAKLYAEAYGLQVFIEEWHSIKETECLHFCVQKHDIGGSYLGIKAKQKKIYKAGSRFAQESIEKAIDHLKLIKRRQLMHMEREKAFIDSFLSKSDKLENEYNASQVFSVPETQDLVRQYLAFD